MKLTSITAAVAWVAVSSGAAFASTVTETIWTTGQRGLQSTGVSLDYTSTGGVTLGASGHVLNSDGSIGSDKRIGEYSYGLGVQSSRYDSHEVDGAGTDEVVKFSFGQTVTVEKIYFTHNDWNDDFAFTILDGADAGAFYSEVDTDGSRFFSSYTFTQDWTGTMFGIGAVGWDDNFKIDGIKFSYATTPPPGPTPVPLPAAGLMLLAGMGGMAALRRRRKNA